MVSANLTGKPIPRERLDAISWTCFSLEAENQLEENIRAHIGPLGNPMFNNTDTCTWHLEVP